MANTSGRTKAANGEAPLRLKISLTERQYNLLHTLAGRNNTSVAAIVRAILDRALAQ